MSDLSAQERKAFDELPAEMRVTLAVHALHETQEVVDQQDTQQHVPIVYSTREGRELVPKLPDGFAELVRDYFDALDESNFASPDMGAVLAAVDRADVLRERIEGVLADYFSLAAQLKPVSESKPK